MSLLPAAASANAGSGQAAKDETVDSLRQRLHEAEHIITGLKAEQKATQDFFLAQNAELKKENNQLREEVFRCQNSQACNNGNEAVAGNSATPSPEDMRNLQECLQEIKHESKEISLQSKEVHRQSEEVRRQTVELRDCLLNKQEEFGRKRRRTDSDTNRNEEEKPVMQFIKTCKQYNVQSTRAVVAFRGALKTFIEDLSRAQGSKLPLPHEKLRQNLTDFVYSREKPGWHCLREACEKGKLSTEVKMAVCPFHDSGCEFVISRERGNHFGLQFTSFRNIKNSTA